MRILTMMAMTVILLFPFAGAISTSAEISKDSCTGARQGWCEADRQRYYHMPQGTRVVPYDWFLALEDKESTAANVRFFHADDNLKQYRFIPDADTSPDNGDRLPVGFTKAFDRQKRPWLGFSCAACHTGELTYQGKTFRIDGGPSMQDALGFAEDLATAVTLTLDLPQHTYVGFTPAEAYMVSKKMSVLPEDKRIKPITMDDCVTREVKGDKFERFANRLHTSLSAEEKAALQVKMCAYLQEIQEGIRVGILKGMNIFPTRWGFGRIDALGRGGNTVLMRLDQNNIAVANAPVSMPHLWGSPQYTWIQWNGSIEHPMARNLSQAIGLNADVAFIPSLGLGQTDEDRYQAAISLGHLGSLEEYVRALQPPQWPKEFPPLDAAKAAEGKRLYRDKGCINCHQANSPPKADCSGDGSDRHQPPCAMHLHMISIETIGTDPTHAFNFYARKVATGGLGQGIRTGAQSVQTITDGVMRKRYAEERITQSEQDYMNGGRKNRWRAPLAYMARPNVAIWATAPFLHNGSVPTLYQLLSPVEERDQAFCLGHLEFDPVKVGFMNAKPTPDPKTGLLTCPDGQQLYDTTRSGNSNVGHEFRNVENCDNPKSRPNGVLGCELKEPEREALIEYLKSDER
jgi:hypothetical protein